MACNSLVGGNTDDADTTNAPAEIEMKYQKVSNQHNEGLHIEEDSLV